MIVLDLVNKQLSRRRGNLPMIVFGLALVIGVVAAVWWLFYFLWNAIAADIFGLPELTFWQSVGLLMLINLLTAGIRQVVKS